MNRWTNTDGSYIPYYGVTVLWLLLTGLRQTSRLAMSMGLSVVIFLLLRTMCLCIKSRSLETGAAMDLQTNVNSHSEQVFQKCSVMIQDLEAVFTRAKDSGKIGIWTKKDESRIPAT